MGLIESCCDERPKFSVEPSLLRRCGEQKRRFKASPAAKFLPTSSEGMSLRVARLVHAQYTGELVDSRKEREHIWTYCQPEFRTRGSVNRHLFTSPIAFETIHEAFTLWMVEDRIVISGPNSLGVELPSDLIAALHFWESLQSFMTDLKKVHSRRVMKHSIITKESDTYVLKVPPPAQSKLWSIYVYDWEIGSFNDPIYASDSGFFLNSKRLLSLGEDGKTFKLLDTASKTALQIPVFWSSNYTFNGSRQTRWFAAQPGELLPVGLLLFSVKCPKGEGKIFRADFTKEGRKIAWTQVDESCACVASGKEEFVEIIGDLGRDSAVLEDKDGWVKIVRFDRPNLGLVNLAERLAHRELTFISDDDKQWHVWRDRDNKIRCDCKIELAKRNNKS